MSTFLIVQCSDKSIPQIHLGQGILVGEVTDHTAIFQARLTTSDTLINGHLPGQEGWIKFQYFEEGDENMALRETDWIAANPSYDFIAKTKVNNLSQNQVYQYKAIYGVDTANISSSQPGRFRTHPGKESTAPVSFVVVTGMNYYHFHYGNYDFSERYRGGDRELGYPALKSIKEVAPDYFIGTGDNVYFDHPDSSNFKRAIETGKNASKGLFGGTAVTDEAGMRRKYHVQFVQPRFKELFRNIATYWEKDDHDYRVNDSDPYVDFPVTHELGVKNFKEQLPVTDPKDPEAVTYRTYQLSKDLQIWLLENRDYRSPNKMPDGQDKTIWGKEQKEWLKRTLLESNATFKLMISPTPMVGPDEVRKSDNHANQKGFRTEGEEFFKWLGENDFLNKGFYLICGDRHWQYHAAHPSGFEEFSCGALVDNNSRAGRLAGDPQSTDPEGLIKQIYVQGTPEEASGGFLMVRIDRDSGVSRAIFSFYDEKGVLLYKVVKEGLI